MGEKRVDFLYLWGLGEVGLVAVNVHVHSSSTFIIINAEFVKRILTS